MDNIKKQLAPKAWGRLLGGKECNKGTENVPNLEPPI